MNEIKLTNEKIIKFYSHANEHYPISDLFMYKYQQPSKNGGYRELEYEFKNKKVISKDDEFFFYSDLIKRMRIYAPLKYLIEPESGSTNPSQKWHLLIAYYLYSELKKDENIKKEDYEVSNWILFGKAKSHQLKCPELCLWMVEAAIDGVIITSKDLYEMFYQAIEFKENASGKTWDCFQWWAAHQNEYWDKISQIILRQEN